MAVNMVQTALREGTPRNQIASILVRKAIATASSVSGFEGNCLCAGGWEIIFWIKLSLQSWSNRRTTSMCRRVAVSTLEWDAKSMTTLPFWLCSWKTTRSLPRPLKKGCVLGANWEQPDLEIKITLYRWLSMKCPDTEPISTPNLANPLRSLSDLFQPKPWEDYIFSFWSDILTYMVTDSGCFGWLCDFRRR